MKNQVVIYGAVAALGLWVGLGCSSDGGIRGAEFSLRASSYPATAGDPMTEGPFTQAASPWNGNVDILFMLDTSLSLTDTDRANFSANLPPLIDEMTDVNTAAIAFALAWGQPGPNAFSGVGSYPNAGYVPGYDGSGYLYDYLGVSDPNYVTIGAPATEDLKLENSIKGVFTVAPPLDSQAAGGEVGTYSFNRMITNHAAEAKAKGFLRTGTPLMVVFVADENDICDPRPLADRPPMDNSLEETSAWQRYCVVGGSPTYTLASMYAAAQAVTAPAPVQFSSIIYPRGFVSNASTQKETGYGYLEATEMTNGVIVDLNSDFSSGLKNLGNAINSLAANIQRAFILHPPAGTFVNPNSIRVAVEGKQVTFRFNQTTNTVLLDYAGHTGDHIVIDYRVIHAD